VSRDSKPAAARQSVGQADLEVGDTAGLETSATTDRQFKSHSPAAAPLTENGTPA